MAHIFILKSSNQNANGKKGKLRRFWVQPIALHPTRAFINQFHSYRKAPRGALFCLRANCENEFAAVAMVCRPIRPQNCDGFTAEIARLVVRDNFPHVGSFLASRCWRVAKQLGYRRLLTYVADTHAGTMWKAAGFKRIGVSSSGIWHNRQPNLPTVTASPVRWEIEDSTKSKQPIFTSENLAALDTIAKRNCTNHPVG